MSFNACLRPPEQQNAPLKPEANTLDIVFPQTRTALQHVFQHIFYAPPGDMAVNSAKFHIRSKYRIHWHGTFVDDELKPSSTGILCVAQSDSLRAVRTWTQSSTHSNDACPTISWAIRLHNFLSGSGSLAAWRSCVFPHRDTPTLMDAAQQRNPSVRVSSGTVSPAAQRTILLGSSRLLQICPDFELWPHSQHHLDSVNRTSFHVRISSHTHPHRTLTSQVLHIIAISRAMIRSIQGSLWQRLRRLNRKSLRLFALVWPRPPVNT